MDTKAWMLYNLLLRLQLNKEWLLNKIALVEQLLEF